MKRWREYRTDLFLLLVLAALALNYGETRSLHDDVIALRQLEEANMQALTATWTSGGIGHTINTPRNEGESNEDWMARHGASLDMAIEKWPPD